MTYFFIFTILAKHKNERYVIL